MPIEFESISVLQAKCFSCDHCKTKFQDMKNAVLIQHRFGSEMSGDLGHRIIDIVVCEKCLIEFAKDRSTDIGIIPTSQGFDNPQAVLSQLKGSAKLFGFSSSEIANHPDNGKHGFWKVVGIHGAALVQTNSAIAAKELSSEFVDSNNLVCIEFLGPTLPEVFWI